MSQTLDLRNADAMIGLLNRAAEAMLTSPLRQGSTVRLPARGRMLATGDLHDNPIHFRAIVQLARLDASPDHHVFFHELIHGEHLVNGVDLSHRMLLRVAELVTRVPQQVHPVLANHELSQMTGRGVSKGAGNSVKLFNDGLEFVYADAWEDVAAAIQTFIRAMPLAILSESGVFFAHSLPAPQLMSRFDCEVINRALKHEDYESGVGAAYLLTWGRNPTEEQLKDLARVWNVRLFVLGHEHVETGCEVRGPRLLRLNSDHEQGAVVSIDLRNPQEAEELMMSAIRLRSIIG